MNTNIYKYDIEIEYMYNDKPYTFDSKNIHTLLIDYNYDDRNMPIMYLMIALDKKIIDDMIKYKDEKTVVVTISKYIDNVEPRIKQNYVKDTFIYIIEPNLNYNENIDYANGNNNSEDINKIIKIGLMKQDLLINNKKEINCIFNNSNAIDILYSNMKHMKLLIEPLDNNITYNSLIIPPLSSITEYVKYIDDQHAIYNTKYRLFYDYDKTYLLSSRGNAIKSIDEGYSTIIINIHDTISMNAKSQGLIDDEDRRAYLLNVDANDINIFEDELTSKKFNNIIGIDSKGNYLKTEINTKDTLNKYSKSEIQKFNSDNLSKLNVISSEIELNSNIVNIIKNDLDTAVFTINKEYYINFYEKLKDMTGKFLLGRKREIYTRDNDKFILTNYLTFKKIP